MINEGGKGSVRMGTHLCSGESALETMTVGTSWSQKIFRMSSRQLVSSRSCPRWWNFITSAHGEVSGAGAVYPEMWKLTGHLEPLEREEQDGRDGFGRDFPVLHHACLVERGRFRRWWIQRCTRR